MATSAYYAWDRDGRPWKVAAPIKAIGDRLRAHGYTVYYLGADDETHLQADYPQDHCPFSVTGWPGRHPYPYVTAMDIMPPKAGQRSKLDGQSLPSLQQLGAQMLADRKANHPAMRWLKYMNWEPERDYGGPCYHESFQPVYRRTASNDRGHIHQSGRTDFVNSQASTSYDPVARVRGLQEEDFMATVKQADWDALIWRIDAIANGRATVVGGPTKGSPVVLNVNLATLGKKIDAVATALAGVDEGVATALRAEFDDIDAGQQATLAAIEQAAAADAVRDAELRELVESAISGEQDAQVVLRIIADRLAQAAGSVDGDAPESAPQG